MTKAQLDVKLKKGIEFMNYRERAYRKECITRGIVSFTKEKVGVTMYYRGRYVIWVIPFTKRALSNIWNAILIAEDYIKELKK